MMEFNYSHCEESLTTEGSQPRFRGIEGSNLLDNSMDCFAGITPFRCVIPSRNDIVNKAIE
jgi:hypothetical protein